MLFRLPIRCASPLLRVETDANSDYYDPHDPRRSRLSIIVGDDLKLLGTSPLSGGTLEAALAAGRFPAMAEDLRLYRSIATMDKKAPLPSLRNGTPTWHKAAALAREWELNQLAGRLEELADG